VKRGDQMLIVEWDRERESFLVEPMDVLEPARARGASTANASPRERRDDERG